MEKRAAKLQKTFKEEGGSLFIPSTLPFPWVTVSPVQLKLSNEPYPKSILFLCSDNLTRGPMAEAIFTRLLFERKMEDQWFVRSASIKEVNRVLSIDERAVKYLSMKNIYPGIHYSKAVSCKDLTHFNIIMCFEKSEFDLAKEMAPDDVTKNRIKLLGKFHPKGEVHFVGSDNVKGSKWISYKEWLEKGTPVTSSDLDDIAVLYEQCFSCCCYFLDNHINDVIPWCLCIHGNERQYFESYSADKIFSVYSDNIKFVIKERDGTLLEEGDDNEENLTVAKRKEKAILDYYAKNRICPKCFKKMPRSYNSCNVASPFETS